MTKGQADEAGFVTGVRGGRGDETWKRYTEYLVEQRMVLRLSGDRLHRALYGSAPALVGPSGLQLGVCDTRWLHS